MIGIILLGSIYPRFKREVDIVINVNTYASFRRKVRKVLIRRIST